jgi:hypothetical protein
MGGRLASDFPPASVEWWTRLMGQTAVSTQVGFMQTIACADIRADLPKIACPTLVVTTDGSGLASVEETTAWQRMIPLSELVVLPGNSYHAAAGLATQWSVHGPRWPSSSVAPHGPKSPARAEFRIASSSVIVAARSDSGNVAPLTRRPKWTEFGSWNSRRSKAGSLEVTYMVTGPSDGWPCV